MRIMLAAFVALVLTCGVSVAAEPNFKLVGIETRVSNLETRVAELEKLLNQKIVGSAPAPVVTASYAEPTQYYSAPQTYSLGSSGGCANGSCSSSYAPTTTRRGFFRR